MYPVAIFSYVNTSNSIHQEIAGFYKLKDFQCKCNECPVTFIADQLISAIEILETKWGPLPKITSGYRCPQHNNVGLLKQGFKAAKYSYHMRGMAVDFALPVQRAEYFIQLCEEIFPHCIVDRKRGFIHCDVREDWGDIN